MAESTGGRQLPLFPTSGAPRDEPERLAPMPPVAPDSSLGAASGAFDDHLARSGKTENTRQAFASDLRLLGKYLGPDRSVGSVTTDDLNRFLSWMLEFSGRPCSEKTYARRVTTLKVFFAWLTESRVLARDPAVPLVHRRAEAPLPLVLDGDQVEALLAAARGLRLAEPGDPRPELVVRLVLDTGVKKGELSRLDVSDLDLETDPPELLVRYDSARWRHKERRIAFDPGLVPLIGAYRERYRPDDRLLPCTARNLEYVLHDLVSAGGLPDRTGFETLRWTSALSHRRAGMPSEELRTRLGLSPVSWVETERKLELLERSAD